MIRRRRRRDTRTCRNPRCGDVFDLWDGAAWSPLCPSCRLAGRWGAYLVAAGAAVYKLATVLLG